MSNSSTKVKRIVIPPVYVNEQICTVYYASGVVRRYPMGSAPLTLKQCLQDGYVSYYYKDCLVIDLIEV